MTEYIKREAAFDAITDLAGKATTRSAYEAVWKSARALEKIPAADVAPSPDWISADEELPPDEQEVLCWYEYFRYGLYNRMYQTFGIGYQFNGNWGGEVAQGRNAKVLAWMPLPEPPEMDGGAE